MSTYKSKCPKCGGNSICTREEGGGWDAYVGDYTITCPDCGYTKCKTQHEGTVSYPTDKPICPFCNIEH